VTATPVTVPDPATGMYGISGDQQVALTWVAPSDTGGSAITYYTVWTDPPPAGQTCGDAGDCDMQRSGQPCGLRRELQVRVGHSGVGALQRGVHDERERSDSYGDGSDERRVVQVHCDRYQCAGLRSALGVAWQLCRRERSVEHGSHTVCLYWWWWDLVRCV
jgi:hypothetical protein